jgi:hypothetical protein
MAGADDAGEREGGRGREGEQEGDEGAAAHGLLDLVGGAARHGTAIGAGVAPNPLSRVVHRLSQVMWTTQTRTW